MSENPTCVIVGASHAGVQAAVSLRQQGWSGGVVLLGEEAHLPYHRPPLSKDYLLGRKERGDILLRHEEFFAKEQIELRVAHRVERIDRQRREVTVRTGEVLRYDKLVLATGTRPRTLDIPGSGLAGVHYLRTLDDVDAIIAGLRSGRRAVIVGGGYIGLEAAASLRQRGLEVTVLEAVSRVMGRVTSVPVSGFFQRIHEEEGVRVCTGASVSAFGGRGRVDSVLLDEQDEVPADCVIVGIGVVPNVELAREAGLPVDDGIVVDEYARTGDPDILAIGDCTWHHSYLYDRWIRLESVQNAAEQARVAAAAICGVEKPYTALPWFWSDQYDVKLQVAGLSGGYGEMVIRGDPDEGRSFSVWYFDGERLLAVDAVNDPRSYVAATRIIPGGAAVDKRIVRDPGADLKPLLAQTAPRGPNR